MTRWRIHIIKIIIDTDKRLLIQESDHEQQTFDLYTKEAFYVIAQKWLDIGWNMKYAYTFSWMGRPIIQLPEDLVRIQEVIYRVKPDVIIETGVAHGGSLIFYASLCKAMEHGRIIGVDVEIRAHNRAAIEAHELSSMITLIEGDSVADSTLKKVSSSLKTGEKALVILDSCHTKQHVLNELEAYHSFVDTGSYIVATDGIMKDLYDSPRGQADWIWNNPTAAALEFSQNHKEFILEQPAWPFNESELTDNLTHWPSAWLRRI